MVKAGELILLTTSESDGCEPLVVVRAKRDFSISERAKFYRYGVWGEDTYDQHEFAKWLLADESLFDVLPVVEWRFPNWDEFIVKSGGYWYEAGSWGVVPGKDGGDDD